MKRLALFLDGTWNDVDDNTNVHRLSAMLAPRDGAIEQRCHYDPGVGTGTFDHVRGGAIGHGLSENVRQAYDWIVANYDDGGGAPGAAPDEIYVFGFSRGAFTARSIAGMLARCGLVRPGAPLGLAQIFGRYQSRKKALHEVVFAGPQDREEAWLVEYCRRVRVRFIGVWDTVGALGVPFGSVPGLSRSSFQFLNTNLSSFYDHAYQALALDEHRKAYDATLWRRFTPTSGPPPAPTAAASPQVVEQRWFVGAHANVGGGYQNDPLAQLPLAWIQSKAEQVGLAFAERTRLAGDEFEAPPVDSFAKFAFGLYRALKFGKRHWRALARPDERKTAHADATPGIVSTLGETLDRSVIERWRAVPSYRPENLVRWARAVGRDVAALEPGPDGGYALERQPG